ncbi:MAG: CRISPR-associated endonuclease Cas2 [bacterium]
MLSGYRLMWITVMFDLPVTSKPERKAATRFRKYLMDQGFEMTQFSIYMRFCTSTKQTETLCKKIESQLPPGGKVNILIITDKQYERILSYESGSKKESQKSPEQYDLF